MSEASEITIRKAKLYDVPAISRIERESFDSPWSPEEITKDVTSEDDSIYFAVAMAGEERAGYAEMRTVKGEAQIYNIAVAPEFRGEGIGERLLTHLIDKCREDNVDLMTLEVRAGNEAAMELYDKLGFKEVGRRKAYYGKSDAILMNKVMGEVTIDVEV